MTGTFLYADVILPLSLRTDFTYTVPVDLAGKIAPGSRVAVEVGHRKIYAGIVADLHNRQPESSPLKPLLEVIDSQPVVTLQQLALWQWIADYYMCTRGDVMKNLFLPAMKLDAFRNDQGEYRLQKPFMGRPSVFYGLSPQMASDVQLQERVLDSLKKARRQYQALNYLIDNARIGNDPDRNRHLLSRAEWCDAGFSGAVIRELVKKELLETVELYTEGIFEDPSAPEQPPQLVTLTEAQQLAFTSVCEQFSRKRTVLLHGISGSGKTEIYMHLIRRVMEKGQDVLFLLPEIAVTTHLLERIKACFENQMLVFHSKASERSRFENYGLLLNRNRNPKLVVGTRSAVGLPFGNLGLVIVDEEHDAGYKQNEPAPRYNARDTAVVMSRIHGCRTLLGSATPSLESYYNAVTGKYGMVELSEAYGTSAPTKITLIDRRSIRKEPAFTHSRRYLSTYLLRTMEDTVNSGKQVILLQNRRGFSTYLECPDCGFVPQCVRCHVSLSYHKTDRQARCHYCGHSSVVPVRCPACGKADLSSKGIGTEKVEEEIRTLYPHFRIQRFDMDTISTAAEMKKVIQRIVEKQIDVIIGTQMLSKGFDFGDVALTAVINADNLLNFPDFRADEKAFQLIWQLSGRAGRRTDAGTSIVQTAQPEHPVFTFLKSGNYKGMMAYELNQRKKAGYPPFGRLIHFTFRHPNVEYTRQAAAMLSDALKPIKGMVVSDPFFPAVDKIKNIYLTMVTVRIPRELPLQDTKLRIMACLEHLRKKPEFRRVHTIVNVDPL